MREVQTENAVNRAALDLATWITTGLLSNGQAAVMPPEGFTDSFKRLTAVYDAGRGHMTMDEGARKLWTARLENSLTDKWRAKWRYLPPAEQVRMHALYCAAADNSNTITRNHLQAVLAFYDYCHRNNIFSFPFRFPQLSTVQGGSLANER